jgi:hypothetical protein
MRKNRLLIEIKLVKESEGKTSREIIDEIYYDIIDGKCIIPWCDSVLKIVKI